MKTLYLLRHAKSSWDDDQLTDEDRPLTRRGKRDCALVATELERSARLPEIIYCSSARRAQDTLKCFKLESPAFNGIDTVKDDAVYTFEMQSLLGHLKELPNNQNKVMIVGHNPALLDLANFLYDGKITRFSTCAFIELEINIEYWDQLRADSAKLIEIIYPKQLR
jgi:phosphohistidine phosphatase